MKSRFEKRLFIVWIALLLITVLQLWLSSFNNHETLTPNAVLTVGVIAMALIKVRFIFREFMEVRHAPVLLSRLTDIWLLITALALLGTYFVGMELASR
jgi:hypothetical protein